MFFDCELFIVFKYLYKKNRSCERVLSTQNYPLPFTGLGVVDFVIMPYNYYIKYFLLYSYFTAITSISINAPFGRADTSTVERAGLFSPTYAP